MSWYKIEFTNDQVVQQEDEKIRNLFEQVWSAKGCPVGFSLYANDSIGEDVLIYYFSPDSVEVMKKMIIDNNGEQCSRPNMDEPILLFGIQNSRM